MKLKNDIENVITLYKKITNLNDSANPIRMKKSVTGKKLFRRYILPKTYPTPEGIEGNTGIVPSNAVMTVATTVSRATPSNVRRKIIIY